MDFFHVLHVLWLPTEVTPCNSGRVKVLNHWRILDGQFFCLNNFLEDFHVWDLFRCAHSLLLSGSSTSRFTESFNFPPGIDESISGFPSWS